MIYLKAKILFRNGKYSEILALAKENNMNLAMVRMFLKSVITYVKISDIEYREPESDKAKELLSKLEKVQIKTNDEFK